MVDSLLHDVGTFQAADIRGEAGFDSPSLLDVALTAPYFHDGSAQSLDELLASGHPSPQEDGNHLTTDEIAALSAFLTTIDPTTAPVETR
jgi:cytochrome c peroxidase